MNNPNFGGYYGAAVAFAFGMKTSHGYVRPPDPTAYKHGTRIGCTQNERCQLKRIAKRRAKKGYA